MTINKIQEKYQMKKTKLVSLENGTPVSIQGMTGKWKRLMKPDDTYGREAMGVGFLSRGDERGWHTHPEGEDEILYIIAGTALVEWKDENGKVCKAEAPAGTSIYTPEGVENNIGNPYQEEMHCVFFIRLNHK
jgi:mannose-6-phosphate isomerase-like protein (cupin superfamily)